jgi:hypothetical protein
MSSIAAPAASTVAAGRELKRRLMRLLETTLEGTRDHFQLVKQCHDGSAKRRVRYLCVSKFRVVVVQLKKSLLSTAKPSLLHCWHSFAVGTLSSRLPHELSITVRGARKTTENFFSF